MRLSSLSSKLSLGRPPSSRLCNILGSFTPRLGTESGIRVYSGVISKEKRTKQIMGKEIDENDLVLDDIYDEF